MDWREAAENGDTDGLAALSNFTVVDEATGLQPLHFASKGGQYRTAEFLIGNGAPVDCRDRFGRTPLYLAVFHQHLEVIRLLLEKSADPDIACQCGTTCVSKAAENGDMETLDLLLQNWATWKTENQDGESPTDLAKRNGHFLVWSKFGNCEKDRVRELHDAAGKGLVEKMKKLIKAGVDPTARIHTASSALEVAIKHKQIEVVQFLLYDTEISQVPTSQRALSVNTEMKTALHLAAMVGDPATVDLLLAAGAIVSARDKFGKTALDYAVRRRRDAAAEILRQWGAKSTATNETSQ